MQLYGVTAATVADRLAFFQDVDTTLMDKAIKDAAADLNGVLQSLEIAIDTILATGSTQYDYAWCATTVELGAAMYYCAIVAAQDGPVEYRRRFNARIEDVQQNPQLLSVYARTTVANSLKSSANAPVEDPLTCQTAYQRNLAARSRFLRPDQRKGSWRL
jgi:hypothetical protein